MRPRRETRRAMPPETCEHRMRTRDCPHCLQDWAEDMAWQRAVDEESHRAHLLGYERPCGDTAYLDLLAELEPLAAGRVA